MGEWREASYLNPPSGRATPLTRGVALVHGGQRPISLEYQINRLPLIISDTLVTGIMNSDDEDDDGMLQITCFWCMFCFLQL